MKKLEILRRFPGYCKGSRSSSTPVRKEFRVKASINQTLANGKRRIERRLDKSDLSGCARPMLTARNIHDGIAGRARGISHGGIGAVHALARQIGLIDA